MVFNNHQVDCLGDVALAMGTYDFTYATTGSVSTVEYTFGYKRCNDGKVRICLHHSSGPLPACRGGRSRCWEGHSRRSSPRRTTGRTPSAISPGPSSRAVTTSVSRVSVRVSFTATATAMCFQAHQGG